METREKAKIMADNGDLDGLVDLYYEEWQLGNIDDIYYIVDLIQEVD